MVVNNGEIEVNPEGRSRKFKTNAEMEKVAAGIECLGHGHVFSDPKEGGLLHRVSQSGQTVSQKVMKYR